MNKTVLCIIDGLGENPSEFGNAVKAAGMKNLDLARANFPSTLIKASGPEVGLVDVKDPGNSEVGHNAIGSGQYIKQGLALLNDRIKSGELFKSAEWKEMIASAKKSKLNIIFLLSDGRTHSDLPHLLAVLKQCAKEKVTVSIHALSDGRDVEPQSVLKYIDITRQTIKDYGLDAKIAMVGGRGKLYMDRYETDTSILTESIKVCALGLAPVVTDIHSYVKQEYAKNPTMTDETLTPVILEPEWLIKNGDAVLLLNYRGDRATQTCDMFEQGKYLDAEQYSAINKCNFFGVLQYDTEKQQPKKFLCAPATINNTLSEWFAKHNVRQFAVTESVKFGHLTYFFDGNQANPFKAELDERIRFQSDICNNMYNSAPKMQAQKILDTAIEAIESGKHDFIKLNIANPDMVGHTGDFDAVVVACKTADDCVGKLIEVCKNKKVNLIITADHGNAEIMKYEKGNPHTSHTNSPVPFVVLPFAMCGKVCGMDHACKKLKIKEGSFGLTNIAATICLLLGIETSPHFNESIIE